MESLKNVSLKVLEKSLNFLFKKGSTTVYHSMQWNSRQSWILDSTQWIPDFLPVELKRIPDSLSCFVDFKAKDSGLRKEKFPRIPDSTSQNFRDSDIQGRVVQSWVKITQG